MKSSQLWIFLVFYVKLSVTENRLDRFYRCISEINDPSYSSIAELVALRWLRVIAQYHKSAQYPQIKITGDGYEIGREDFSIAHIDNGAKSKAHKEYKILGISDRSSLTPTLLERTLRSVGEPDTTTTAENEVPKDVEFEELFLKHMGRMSPGNLARVIDRLWNLALRDD